MLHPLCRLLAPLVLLVVIGVSRAEPLYCPASRNLTVSGTHLLKPTVVQYIIPDDGSFAHDACSWRMRSESALQVAFEGIPQSCYWDMLEANKRKRLQRSVTPVGGSGNSTITISLVRTMGRNTSNVTFALTVGTFFLAQLNHRDLLDVTVASRGVTGRSPVVVKVTPIAPGHCAEDMAHHSGHCYHTLRWNLTLSEAWSMLTEPNCLQLASFKSFGGIQGFLNSSQNPGTGKVAISFVQPARTDLFRSREGEILSAAGNGKGQCVPLELFNLTGIPLPINSSGACGTLKVSASGLPVVEFSDCNWPIATLLRFPDRPSSASASACTVGCSLEQLLLFLEEYSHGNKRETAPDQPFRNSIIIGVVLASIIFVFIVFIVVIIVVKWKNARTGAGSVYISQHDQPGDKNFQDKVEGAMEMSQASPSDAETSHASRSGDDASADDSEEEFL